MGNSYADDRSWADGHIDEINRVVRKVAGKIVSIQASDEVKDRRDGVDYEVAVSGGNVACRIRRADKYTFRDLTLTVSRPSGVRPEIEKLSSASGPAWYLYAWAHAGRFVEWMFVDVGKLRKSGLLARSQDAAYCRRSPDGSAFLFIPVPDLFEAGAILEHDLRPATRRFQSVS